MNELPLPIWFFLLYPLCWIVLFPVLTLWSSLLYLAASRFDRNSLPPVLPRRPWLRLGVLAWVCHVGAAGCTLLLLLILLTRLFLLPGRQFIFPALPHRMGGQEMIPHESLPETTLPAAGGRRHADTGSCHADGCSGPACR